MRKMKSHRLFMGALALALCVALAAGARAADEAAPARKAKKGGKGRVMNQPPKGFTALFNGKDLGGWWGESTTDPEKYLHLTAEALKARQEKSLPDIQQHWRVEKGELVNDGKGLYLTTDKWFKDFDLRVEYKALPLGDSGVYLRGCPQVQIWDYTEKAKFPLGSDKGSGALWNNSPGAPGKDPLVLADKPFGQWNRFRIVMAGDKVWVWLNGKQTVNGAVMENYYDKARKRPVPAEGPVQLQTHGSEIRWRNVFIRELTPEESEQWKKGEGR